MMASYVPSKFLEGWKLNHAPDLLLLPSDALAALPVHAILFAFKSPFLRSLLRSLDNKINGKDIILSLPFTSLCLEKLLALEGLKFEHHCHVVHTGCLKGRR